MTTDVNLYLAKNWLMLAVSNPCNDNPINQYIKFMDTLPKEERDNILLNPEITKLVERINR